MGEVRTREVAEIEAENRALRTHVQALRSDLRRIIELGPKHGAGKEHAIAIARKALEGETA